VTTKISKRWHYFVTKKFMTFQDISPQNRCYQDIGAHTHPVTFIPLIGLWYQVWNSLRNFKEWTQFLDDTNSFWSVLIILIRPLIFNLPLHKILLWLLTPCVLKMTRKQHCENHFGCLEKWLGPWGSCTAFVCHTSRDRQGPWLAMERQEGNTQKRIDSSPQGCWIDCHSVVCLWERLLRELCCWKKRNNWFFSLTLRKHLTFCFLEEVSVVHTHLPWTFITLKKKRNLESSDIFSTLMNIEAFHSERRIFSSTTLCLE